MQWIPLAPFPVDITFSNVAMISNKAFVAVPNHCKTDEGAKSDGIYVYYSTTNQWSIFWTYPKWITMATDSIAEDRQNKKLYLLNKAFNSSVNIMDIASKSFRTKEQKKETALSIGSGSTSVIIDGELHVIGGKSNPRHVVYKNKEFCVIHRWKKMRSFFDHGLLYIKKRNILLLFGGTQWKGNKKTDTDAMYSYCCASGTWTKLKETLPSKCSKFGYILSNHDDFICLFDTKTRNIYILDLDTMKFRTSDVKCPTSAACYAVFPRKGGKVHLIKRSGGEHWSIFLSIILKQNTINDENVETKEYPKESEMKLNDTESSKHKVKSSPYAQALLGAKLTEEIKRLKAKNELLSRMLSKSQETLLKSVNSKLLTEKSEFELKYLRIQKALCYNRWTVDDVYQWIIHLDNDRYKKYSKALLHHLQEENINGSCLEIMNELDLHRIGIKDFRDKKLLKKQIDGLILNHKRKEDELSICTICYNDTISFAVEPCHHLYCKPCANSFQLCPKCRTKITSSFQVYN